jgi:hypothetical protein
MRQIVCAEGGRPFYDDDLETIQGESLAAVVAVLTGLGQDCIVEGCGVTATGATYTVAPGFVFMGGQLLRFLGASGVTLPAALVTGSVSVLDERVYETGDTKTCIQEQFAVIEPDVPQGLQLYPAGGLTMAHALRNRINEVGDIKWGALNVDNYDSTGRGLPGTAAWGWGLCNGQKGRYDLRGAFVAGYDPDRTDYAAVGNVGGKETVALTLNETPAHAHESPNRIVDSRGDGEAEYLTAYTASTGARGKNITTKSAGGGQAHENRPPFYVLAARQWEGL